MAEELFIIIVWAVLVIGIGLSVRLLSTAMLNKSVRLALRDHPASAGPLLEKIVERRSWPDNLLGVGMIAIAVGNAALALLEPASEGYARIEAAFLLAMIGAAVLFFAQVQRDGLRTLVAQQARETPGLLPAAAWLDTETPWADAVLMVMVAAIALAFTIMTLVAYWDDYPAIVIGGILASLAIAAAVLYRRRQASGRSD
jgi:hypothetical protein